MVCIPMFLLQYVSYSQIPITIRTSTIQYKHYHYRCVMLVPGHLMRYRTTLSRTSRLRRILPDSDSPTTPQASLRPTSESQPHTAFLRRRKTYRYNYNTDTIGMDIFIHARNTELLIKEQIPLLSNNVRRLSNTSVPLNNPEQTDKLGHVTAESARIAQATPKIFLATSCFPGISLPH